MGLLQGLGHEIISAHHDIYGVPEYEPDTPLLREVKTYYEELFSSKGKTITYIKFRLNKYKVWIVKQHHYLDFLVTVKKQ